MQLRENLRKYPVWQVTLRRGEIWGLKTTDRSIDHRRVPNLRTFFARKGWSVPITENAADYEPGDLVTWNLSDSIPHIGIVSDRKTEEGTPMSVVGNRYSYLFTRPGRQRGVVRHQACRAGKKQEDEKGRRFHRADGEGNAEKSDEAGKADVRPALHAVKLNLFDFVVGTLARFGEGISLCHDG